MHDQSPKPALLVFLKYPEPGRVKTRLAAEIGPVEATGLYRKWIGTVLRNVQPVRPAVRVVGYFAGAAANRFAEWEPYVDAWQEQPKGDLGTRLSDGFEWSHRDSRPVIAIGTDCPDLTASHVRSALEMLREYDMALGPATDGGYYLVGSARHVPGLFDGVRWSSPQTLADQRRRCDRLGLSVGLLPPLADIDTLDDWQAYQRRGRE